MEHIVLLHMVIDQGLRNKNDNLCNIHAPIPMIIPMVYDMSGYAYEYATRGDGHGSTTTKNGLQTLIKIH